jgi:branched-chain amino acid transport system substrate-binding protein
VDRGSPTASKDLPEATVNLSPSGGLIVPVVSEAMIFEWRCAFNPRKEERTMKGHGLKKWGISLTLILATSALVFSVPAPAAAGGTIKVGIIDCYTGPAAVYTKQTLAAFEMALKEENERGVLGKKIEFVTRDSKFKVELALNYAKELVMREGVDLLIGEISSSNILAISEYCRKIKMPFITWAGGSDKITGEKGHRYVFQTASNTAMAGRAGGLGLSKKGDDYAYGHDIADACFNSLKKLRPDVELLGQSWWKLGESDFTPYITNAMAAKPDCLIAATGGASMAPFMRLAKETGLSEKIPIWINTAIDYTSVKPLGKNGPEGVLGTVNYLFYYPKTEANKKFVDAFRKATGDYPGWFALAGYITGHIIAEGYRKAGAVDKEKFVDALEGMTIDTPTGQAKIRPYDHLFMQPIFWGVTKYLPGYDFLMATDLVAYPPEELAPSIEEVKKARGE